MLCASVAFAFFSMLGGVPLTKDDLHNWSVHQKKKQDFIQNVSSVFLFVGRSLIIAFFSFLVTSKREAVSTVITF